MTKKAIIQVDLAATVGTAKLKLPTRALPRHDKAQLELIIAGRLLHVVRSRSNDSFTGLRTNTDDPPDVLFEHNGVTTGIELTELLPPNRLEKDAIIRSLRQRILSGLDVGPKTKNRVVNIFFTDDYSEKLRPNDCVETFARLLNDFFESSNVDRCELAVPSELQGVASRIFVDAEDLSGDPRLDDENHPLIIFGAQNTMIVPENDIPEMFDATVGRKLRHDLSFPAWLLAWSHHPAIGSVQDEVVSHLSFYLSQKYIKYQRVFYLGLATPGIMAHIPVVKDGRPLFDTNGT